jgi:hypothetical protein
MDRNTELGRFAALLVTLAVMLLILSWAAETGHRGPFLSIASSVVLVGGVYAVSRRRIQIILGLAFAIAALVSGWAWELLQWRWLLVSDLALTGLFLFLIAAFVLDAVRRREQVDADTVLGGVCAYLLFVVAFMYVHGLVETLSPDSYRLAGSRLGDVAAGSSPFVQFFYFSMVTITTLGYGDMVPTAGVARLLCGLEAIFGQLFVAIFIARLVSLYTVSRAPATTSSTGDM